MIIEIILGLIGMLAITAGFFLLMVLSVIIWGVILNWLPFVQRFLSEYLKLSDEDIAFLPFYSLILWAGITLIF